MRKPHQRFDEAVTSKPDRQSDLTATPPEQQPAIPISDRSSTITSALPEHEPRNQNLEPSDRAAMRRPEPTHEHEPTAQREWMQTRTAPAHEMSHLVKPSVVPTAKGEARGPQSVVKTDSADISVEASASSKRDGKSQGASLKNSAGEVRAATSGHHSKSCRKPICISDSAKPSDCGGRVHCSHQIITCNPAINSCGKFEIGSTCG